MRYWFVTTIKLSSMEEYGEVGMTRIRTRKMKQNNTPAVPLRIIFPEYMDDNTTVFLEH